MAWIIRYMKGNKPADAYRNNSAGSRALIDVSVRHYAEETKSVRALFVELYGADCNAVQGIDREAAFAAKWYAEYMKEAAHDHQDVG